MNLAAIQAPPRDAAQAPTPHWHVLWTHSNCEQLVHDQLAARGFRPFLPRVEVWKRVRGARRVTSLPLFPGYLFLHDALDKERHVELRKAPGLVSVLGASWDRPAVVPDREVEAIRRLVDSGLSPRPHPFLRHGDRVRILRGPLAGVEGILARSHPRKGLFVLSVELLGRSVAVELDCTDVVPA